MKYIQIKNALFFVLLFTGATMAAAPAENPALKKFKERIPLAIKSSIDEATLSADWKKLAREVDQYAQQHNKDALRNYGSPLADLENEIKISRGVSSEKQIEMLNTVIIKANALQYHIDKEISKIKASFVIKKEKRFALEYYRELIIGIKRLTEKILEEILRT